MFKKESRMEALSVLEKKVAVLVSTIKQQKIENSELVERLAQSNLEKDQATEHYAQLAAENARLVEKLELIETSIMSSNERADELDQERALTKMVVDDLIESINTIVPIEDQQL
jgi:predicted nuclease with TOPRIM domain